MSIMDTLTSLMEVKLDIGIEDIDNDLRVSFNHFHRKKFKFNF